MKIKIGVWMFIAGIFAINFINALGVGAPYFEEGFLRMNSGETKEFNISLQNADIEEGVVLRGEMLNGSEIAFFDKESYEVEYGNPDVYALLTIKIPENITEKSYQLIYKFSQENVGEGGMVQLGIGIETGFKVVVGNISVKDNFSEKISNKILDETPENVLDIASEKPADENKSLAWLWLLIVVVLIVCIAGVYYFIKMKRFNDNSDDAVLNAGYY